MQLPLTSYDRLKKLRPEMWTFLAQDVQALQREGEEGPIFSLDDIGGGKLKECLDFFANELIRKLSASSGLSDEIIRAHVSNVSEFQHQLKLLTQSVVQDYHNCLNFELSGKKTFFFSDNLTDNLAETEIEIDPSLLRPPFDCSLFVFTAKSIINAACRAFDPKFNPGEREDGVLSAMLVYHSDRATKESVGFNSLLMGISYWEGNRQLFYVKRELALFPGGSLEQALKTEWNDHFTSDCLGSGRCISDSGEDRQTTDREFYTDGLHLFRIVLNAILYLSSSGSEITQRLSGRNAALERADKIKSRSKSKAARKSANRESILDFASVGETVGPIFISPGSGANQSDNPSGNRHTYKRFVVRGHWRNQAYGEGMSKRKLIWIMPHFKGPELTEVVSRPYFAK